MCVFLRFITKMKDQFLEQQINIKFCVKLGKNSSDTCVMLSDAYVGEAMKMSCVFEWHKPFKKGREDVVKMMKGKVVQDLREPMKML